MGIGQMRQVSIIPLTHSKSDSGAWQKTEGTPYRVWAEVTDPSGFNVYQNGQTQLGQTKTFTIRFRFDRTPDCDWRLIYDGRRWTVTEIRRVDEKKFYYRLTATSKSDS
jgi:SPP1 family predicted phage head-tail adaptor